MQTSVDGQEWTTIGRGRGQYGESTSFAFGDLVGVTASYVRIVAERDQLEQAYEDNIEPVLIQVFQALGDTRDQVEQAFCDNTEFC